MIYAHKGQELFSKVGPIKLFDYLLIYFLVTTVVTALSPAFSALGSVDPAFQSPSQRHRPLHLRLP